MALHDSYTLLWEWSFERRLPRKTTSMGWLQWVGCLKIQVSLQNTDLFCRALLQKRPIFLSILLIVATPYQERRETSTKKDVFRETSSRDVYGVATISRMLENIGLFCKRALQKRPVFWKQTCIFKHPTHRIRPIPRVSCETLLWEWSFERRLSRTLNLWLSR